jgi:predicted permease
MLSVLTDVRYAIRQFRHSPAFTLTAILTLALGIGGTTAIFSLIHTVMLRSLPIADPAGLYRIGSGNHCCVEGDLQENWGLYSFPLFQRLKAAMMPEFEQVAAFGAAASRFPVRPASAGQPAKSVRTEFVTGNYFSTMGVGSFAGRLFSPKDDQPAASPVAVLSYRVWQQEYGGDPGVIGASFVLNSQPFTVVGIAPPGFYGETLRSQPPDLWLPLEQEPLVLGQNSLLYQSTGAWLRVLGRPRPGTNIPSLPAKLTVVLRDWLKNDSGIPANFTPELLRQLPKQFIQIIPAGRGVATMQEAYGSSLRILLTVCSLVLLIACGNIANLMLARGMARRSQTSLRLAIGASRGRLIRQALTESLLLSAAGGLVGLLVAEGAGMLILELAFHRTQLVGISTSPSLPVLTFALVVSLLTGVLFGTAPAWFTTTTNPGDALRGVNRSTREAASKPQQALLILQAALSVVLVAGAALLTQSLRNLENQDFGFQTKNRVEVSMNPPPAAYSPERLDALYRELENKLNQIPGVEHASLALYGPFTDNWSEHVEVKNHPTRAVEDRDASWDRVDKDYLQAVGQPLLRGRSFTDQDRTGSEPVAIVNQAFVSRFFPHEDPIGQHFGMDLPQLAGTYRVVGTVRNAKYTTPDKAVRPMFFVPLLQNVAYQDKDMKLLEVRSHFISHALLVSRRPPGELEPLVRRALSEADQNMTIIDIYAMEQQVGFEFDQERAVAGLTSLFGLVALVLAGVGLYGVTAYTVARRTSEIGVRMALGAGRDSVVKLVLRGAFSTIAVGLLIGIPAAIGAGKLIAAELYGVTNTDPIALSLSVAALAICAFVAAILPALRAAAIDPMTALRSD